MRAFICNESFFYLSPVSFMPQKETAADMARRLCVEKAEEIGGLTNENVVSSCIEPVAAFFDKEVAKWLADKTIELTVKLNDEEFSG